MRLKALMLARARLPGVSSAFEAEKHESNKGVIATRYKCAIAAKRRALNWRAISSRALESARLTVNSLARTALIAAECVIPAWTLVGSPSHRKPAVCRRKTRGCASSVIATGHRLNLQFLPALLPPYIPKSMEGKKEISLPRPWIPASLKICNDLAVDGTLSPAYLIQFKEYRNYVHYNQRIKMTALAKIWYADFDSEVIRDEEVEKKSRYVVVIGNGLCEGTIPAFARSNFGNPWDTDTRMAGSGIERGQHHRSVQAKLSGDHDQFIVQQKSHQDRHEPPNSMRRCTILLKNDILAILKQMSNSKQLQHVQIHWRCDGALNEKEWSDNRYAKACTKHSYLGCLWYNLTPHYGDLNSRCARSSSGEGFGACLTYSTPIFCVRAPFGEICCAQFVVACVGQMQLVDGGGVFLCCPAAGLEPGIDLLESLQLHNSSRQGVSSTVGPQGLRPAIYLQKKSKSRGGRGGVVVRLLTSHQGVPGSISYTGPPPDFRMWESCRKIPLVSGFYRGSPVPPSITVPHHTHLASYTHWFSRPQLKHEHQPVLCDISLRLHHHVARSPYPVVPIHET
ncbi:hypothetical protein PR048_028205 [Dryococelus australis]|uniref:Uncharacterized protein n=1 Tax=Dryococelus australis TaxID=614101 RepID=A0ABQ9GIL6_9NEOP|nr:hypothetical protein PR048_028205 [Dryococelus australis]